MKNPRVGERVIITSSIGTYNEARFVGTVVRSAGGLYGVLYDGDQNPNYHYEDADWNHLSRVGPSDPNDVNAVVEYLLQPSDEPAEQ